MTILKPMTERKLFMNTLYKLMIKLHGLDAVKQTLRRQHEFKSAKTN